MLLSLAWAGIAHGRLVGWLVAPAWVLSVPVRSLHSSLTPATCNLRRTPSHIIFCPQRLLPPGLVSALAAGGAPQAALALLQGRSESPELIWDQSMAHQAAAEVAALAHGARTQQAAGGAAGAAWALPPGGGIRYQRLAHEVMVGGVYCRWAAVGCTAAGRRLGRWSLGMESMWFIVFLSQSISIPQQAHGQL